MVQNFVQEKKLGATKLQAKDFEIENLEINVLTQNFKTITKIKEIKKLSREGHEQPHVQGHSGQRINSRERSTAKSVSDF